MVARAPQAFQRRINQYVPSLAYAAEVIENAPSRISLGAPSVGNVEDILNDTSIVSASSTTTLLQTELSGTYGRNLQLRKPTGAATGTVTITGRDYLGQPMKETISTVASTTTIVQGKKAFKYIDEVSWTAHAGSTLDLGTGNKLGVPYVIENFLYAFENGVRLERNTGQVVVRASITDTNTAATWTVKSPVKGNIVGVQAVITTIIGAANEALTFNVNGGTAIGGLALSLLTAGSAVGVTFQKSVANGTANCAVLAGDTINILNDGASASGAAEVDIIIQPEGGIFTDAVLTDPQTATTGDPRGLYEAFNTLDGSKVIEIVATFSRWVNSNGRGGLHGIAQFFS